MPSTQARLAHIEQRLARMRVPSPDKEVTAARKVAEGAAKGDGRHDGAGDGTETESDAAAPLDSPADVNSGAGGEREVGESPAADAAPAEAEDDQSTASALGALAPGESTTRETVVAGVNESDGDGLDSAGNDGGEGHDGGEDAGSDSDVAGGAAADRAADGPGATASSGGDSGVDTSEASLSGEAYNADDDAGEGGEADRAVEPAVEPAAAAPSKAEAEQPAPGSLRRPASSAGQWCRLSAAGAVAVVGIGVVWAAVVDPDAVPALLTFVDGLLGWHGQ